MAQGKTPFDTVPVTWPGRLFYYAFHRLNAHTQRNINAVFSSQLSDKQKKRLIMGFYSHRITLLREFFISWFWGVERLKKRVEMRGLEHLLDAVKMEKGVLLLTGHFGNWELTAPLGFNMLPIPNPMFAVRKSLKVAWAEKLFFGRYQQHGISVIHRDNAISGILKALKQQGLILFPFDQRVPSESREGLVSDFLGLPARAYKSLALLAKRTGAPVVPISCHRLEKGRHRIEFYPPLSWQDDPEPAAALLKNTTCYNETLANILLRYPEQWIWSYNRWQI